MAIGFPFLGEVSPWILGFGVPSKSNPSSGPLKSALPGPREGSMILNVDLVAMTAAVYPWVYRVLMGLHRVSLGF